MKPKIIYGPVLSRRLGRSLGIDAKDLAVIIEELLRGKNIVEITAENEKYYRAVS